MISNSQVLYRIDNHESICLVQETIFEKFTFNDDKWRQFEFRVPVYSFISVVFDNTEALN